MSSEHTATSETQPSERDPNAAPGRLEIVRRFLNTHDFEDDVEKLTAPADLARWFTERGLLEAGTRVTEAELARALDVREALRQLGLRNNGYEWDERSLDTLRAAAAAAPVVIRPDPDAPGLEPAVTGVAGSLAALLAIVHEAMADGTWERFKVCPADDCLWAFYDRSRNRSGHWCSMAVCGNRAKARNYRSRHTRSATGRRPNG